jgi:hypothetical protein
LRPQSSETLAAYSDRLRERYRIGPFLAGQVIADLKHVAPLRNASDWWTFAVPGPGSERGLNRVCKRSLKATWSEAQWLATLLRLREETAPQLEAAGIAALDAQNVQNVLCEFDKYERAREAGGEPSRKYKAAEAKPKAKPKAKPQRRAKAATISGVLAASEAPDTVCITMAVSPPLVPEPGATAHEPHCLAAALAYAAKGWRIFPAPRGEKKSYKSGAKYGGARWGATNDPEKIKRDFARWPNANIGLPTGAENGFWVLEVDTPKGHDVDGFTSLQALIAKHGELPPTLTAESPSGSRHYYFRWPADVSIRNSASEIGAGIDLRGEGGMVIAPPSIKPEVGAYCWIDEIAIADAPGWLLTLATFSGGSDEHTPNSEPQAPLPLIKAALDVIPIKGMNYTRWIAVGHAVHAASGGSDEGWALFDAWTQQSSEYNASGLAAKWHSFHPHSIGFGSLVYWANEADPTWRDRFDAQVQAELWRIDDTIAASSDTGDNTSSASTAGTDSGQSNTKTDGEADKPKADDWPVLKPEAMHGLAGEIVRAIEPHTESDPVALLVQTLTFFGNAVGRGPYFMAESDWHYPNLFTVLVGQSGRSRKGTSAGRILDLMGRADPEWAPNCVHSGVSSGEGVIAQVRDASKPKKQKDGMLAR